MKENFATEIFSQSAKARARSFNIKSRFQKLIMAINKTNLYFIFREE